MSDETHALKKFGPDGGKVAVRTKSCWICGQYSVVMLPAQAWHDYYMNDIHLDAAWPDGPVVDKRLIMTGVHLKCWNEEFPETPETPDNPHSKENKNA